MLFAAVFCRGKNYGEDYEYFGTIDFICRF